ncbi:MAG: asparagine synthase (glutamine-hydrolyzing) [Chloroflexota bacterium]
MCGIAGFIGPNDPELLERLTECMRHRGPDEEGTFETDGASIMSRRLAIIDLAHGQQPMHTPDGKLHLVYNGELYNYRELRDELRAEGVTFATDSDTEVVLQAYACWGTDAFRRFNGMWGLAFVDDRGPTRQVVLCRDHFGIKPLYWTRAGERLIFGSEIKSFFQSPDFTPRVNEQRLYEYLGWGLHEHDRDTFFADVHQLLPATYAIVEADGSLHEEAYWTPDLRTDGDPSPERFRELFERSVERRLVGEVPVGTCLSGGLDSSTIVMIMSRQLREHVRDAGSMGDRLKTFSAVFAGDPIDEREYIEHVLEASGAEGNFVNPSSAQFIEELPQFVWYLDEPIVSTGPYAQWAVMRLARSKVTVLLDGQGGDELLAGYTPYGYVYLRQLLRERRFGTFAREAFKSRDVLLPLVRRVLASRRKGGLNVGALLRSEFRARVRRPHDPRVRDDLKKRLLQDLTAYSLPSLLRYDDRNSMAFSVESRVPFLDQELVDHILSLPETAIIRNGWSRAILRDAMKGILPEKIRLRRWKVGFTTPEMRWIRQQRAYFEELVRSESFASRPYWNGAAVASAFTAALDGEGEESLFFWRAINTELWLRVFFDRDGSTPPDGPNVVPAREAVAATVQA